MDMAGQILMNNDTDANPRIDGRVETIEPALHHQPRTFGAEHLCRVVCAAWRGYQLRAKRKSRGRGWTRMPHARPVTSARVGQRELCPAAPGEARATRRERVPEPACRQPRKRARVLARR